MENQTRIMELKNDIMLLNQMMDLLSQTSSAVCGGMYDCINESIESAIRDISRIKKEISE